MSHPSVSPCARPAAGDAGRRRSAALYRVGVGLGRVGAGAARAWRVLCRPRHGTRSQERGVALLIVISWLALMISLVAEFTYGTSVDTAQAANARDELRAHYMARSSIALSRLLVKIQQRFIDPIMQQAQAMIAQMGAGDLGVSLRITDYAGPIMGMFGGSQDEVSSLTSLIGLDAANIKGLGMKAGRFDAEITSEDGKLNINCGGGSSPSQQRQKQTFLFHVLTSMMYAPRFDKLFQTPMADGALVDRADVARAIVDWADADDQMFFPPEAGGGSGSEDYRYDARADRYKAHDNYYDSVEEVAMVRGARDMFLQAFQPYLTVYPADPSCRVNLAAIKGDCTTLLMGLLRAAAMPDPTKPPTDPSILDDRRLYPLASLMCERGSVTGFDSTDAIVNLLGNPQQAVLPDDPRYPLFQGMRGITITKADLEKVAFVNTSARVFRIVATGEAGRVKKKITAIVDMGRTPDNPITQNAAAERANGVLQYWREE